MAKLLLHTASLIIKIDGRFNLPQDKKCKTATIKKLLKIIQQEPSQIQFLGYDFEKSDLAESAIEDCLIVGIHVIEDPILINYNEPTEQIVKYFIKQLKLNTSRIMLENSRSGNGKQERNFDFYVRGVGETKALRTLKQA